MNANFDSMLNTLTRRSGAAQAPAAPALSAAQAVPAAHSEAVAPQAVAHSGAAHRLRLQPVSAPAPSEAVAQQDAPAPEAVPVQAAQPVSAAPRSVAQAALHSEAVDTDWEDWEEEGAASPDPQEPRSEAPTPQAAQAPQVDAAGMPLTRHRKGTPVKRKRKKGTVRLTERDQELLDFAALSRVISADYAYMWLHGTPHESTIPALSKRLRELAQAGWLRQYFPAHRQGIVYVSTKRGVALTSYDIPPHLMRSGALETSLPHALLITYEIARQGEAIRSGRLAAVPDSMIKRAVATAREDSPLWTPFWDPENSDPYGDAADLALKIPHSPHSHIPDLVFVDRETGQRMFIEVECSQKSRQVMDHIAAAYIDANAEVLWVVGNRIASSVPDGTIFKRLIAIRESKGLDPNMWQIEKADMRFATPQPITRS